MYVQEVYNITLVIPPHATRDRVSVRTVHIFTPGMADPVTWRRAGPWEQASQILTQARTAFMKNIII